MQARSKLKPAQKGTRKLVELYGSRLVLLDWKTESMAKHPILQTNLRRTESKKHPIVETKKFLIVDAWFVGFETSI